MTSTLLELSNMIAASVATLNKVCSKNVPFPDLDDPFAPHSEAFRTNPEAAEAANVIAAAANQLVAMVLPPPAALFSIISGHCKSAALRVCLEANVTEILREGGPQGVHVDHIGKKANISSEKIARLLRYLATNHVYKEISPDIFVNNRISSLLDTGKSVNDLLASPDQKYVNTTGFAALAGHQLDEITKASAYLWENMSDPVAGHSIEVSKAPFNRVFDFDGPFWTWYAQPDQVDRQRRFGVAMQGVAALEPEDFIWKAFDWNSLPKGAVVVDVGGGVGTSSLILAKKNSDIKIVVQDRLSVIQEANAVWKTEIPQAIESGRVTLQAHDFFQPQPIKNASVFLVKQILHDWPDAYTSKILTKLREVAQSETKLIIIDNIVPFACHDPSADEGKGISGAVPKEAPQPLLANYGIANEMGYNYDLAMLMAFNSQERTVKDLQKLLASTGWRLTRVSRGLSNNFLQPMEAVPVF